uniref:U6 snRNA-associated Sm-like protein LSm1 n=1 Tax=Arcella intermedia TaxID=1963864 RepID=A0A6B2LQE1_9EUKA
MATATISLVDDVDKQVLVVLRDGRKLIGMMRSFDQFANIVLENTIERIFVGQQYCEKSLGSYVIRGENVVLLGEIDTDIDDEIKQKKLQRLPEKELLKLHQVEKKKLEEQEKRKRKIQLERGIIYDNDDM